MILCRRSASSRFLALSPLLLLLTTASAAPTSRPVTGQLHLTFTQASPQSDLLTVRRRMGALKPPTDEEITAAQYDPARDPFDAFVPSTYKPDGTFGLFVWVGVSDPSPEWMPVLARHKLLFVSAKPHDESEPYYHPRRELDAVYNMCARYKLNPARIYISGFSAGGQIAAFAFHFFPDVFKGGVFISGDAFHPVYSDKTGRLICTVRDNAPWQAPLEQIRKEASIVLISGGNEYKPDPDGLTVPRAQFEGLVLDGFERVSVFQIPRAGHNHPNASWFEKAVAALEHPQSKPPAPTTSPTTDPNPLASQLFQARRVLATAQWHLEFESSWNRTAEPKEAARQRLQQVLDEYPTTPSAAKAKELLSHLAAPTTRPTSRTSKSGDK